MSDQTTEPTPDETLQPSDAERAAGEDESVESLEDPMGDFVDGDELDQKRETARQEILIHDADAEDALEESARLALAEGVTVAEPPSSAESYDDEMSDVRSMADLMAIIEALIFVSEEPLTLKMMSDVIQEERGWVEAAVEELAQEFNERNSGLQLREVGGGWQIATRPEYHEYVRAYLKSRPSAKLSLASLETLAVIAYKQPITVPEILEIRGVQSPSAIKTLLDKRLIVAKGRKETIGRPMMYGTSKEFLLQFGLKDLSELPSIEDFEDLAGGM
ncbi:MAG TPA: SMC-Scp complex subunit ScpB [Pyrinomonadaceae bacterium]|jgi:segregation and condensation protein B|nr:SMC-Scp complex subunit ScpB [Pyrinomonadaceae bacterium]